MSRALPPPTAAKNLSKLGCASMADTDIILFGVSTEAPVFDGASSVEAWFGLFIALSLARISSLNFSKSSLL
jgi:hypothetical protein